MIDDDTIALFGRRAPVAEDIQLEVVSFRDRSSPIGHVTIPNTADRMIIGACEERGFVHLALQHVANSPRLLQYRDVEVITFEARHHESKPIGAVTIPMDGDKAFSAAIAGGYLCVTRVGGRALGYVDISDPSNPTKRTGTLRSAVLANTGGWMAGTGSTLFVVGRGEFIDRTGAREMDAPFVKVINIDGSPPTLRLLSTTRIRDAGSVIAAEGDVAAVLHPGGGATITLLRQAVGNWVQNGVLEALAEAAAIAFVPGASLLVVLSIYEPRVELWELTSSGANRIDSVDYVLDREAYSTNPPPSLIVGGGTASFIIGHALYTVALRDLPLTPSFPSNPPPLPPLQPR
ncbi:hypothetical protein [Agromyces tropicus]